MQAKLLRVIQNREIQRVGSAEVRHVNVRLIGRRTVNCARKFSPGRFSRGFVYRLNSIQIRIQCWRNGLEDIPCSCSSSEEKYTTPTARKSRVLRGGAQTGDYSTSVARNVANWKT